MIALFSIICIGIISFILTEWLPLPWFTPIVIAFIVGLITAKMKTFPFMVGFIGVSMFWFIKLLFPFFNSENILSLKMSNLFTDQLGFTITPLILVLLTIFIGGLLGGIATLSGNLILALNADRPNLLRRGRSNRRTRTYKLKLN